MKKKYNWPGVEYGSPEYYRRWRAANTEHSREYHREYDRTRLLTHPETEKARRKRWKELNPEKTAAHMLVYTAKRNRGIYHSKHAPLTPGPCEVCGATEKIHAHHEDYSNPLEVNWLCPLHHKAKTDEKYQS